MFVTGAFLVGSIDGAVTTATMFASYLDGHFEVVVRARDGGGLFDTIQINIYVVKRDQSVTLKVSSSHQPYVPSCVRDVFNASNAMIHVVGMRPDSIDRVKIDAYVVKTDENIICNSQCAHSLVNSTQLQSGCSDLAVVKTSQESTSWTDLAVGLPILIISMVGAVLFTATFTSLIIVCCRYRKNPPKRYRTSSLAAAPRNIPTAERLRSVEIRGSTIRRTWGSRSRRGKNRPRIFPPESENGGGPLEFKVLSKEEQYEEPLFSGVDEDIACSVNDVLIERKWLKLGQVFAKGNFGQVLKGTLKTQVEVAVKTLQGSRQNLNTFLREGIMMRQFNHRNVLGLVGICLHPGEPPMIIIPYMKNGDLLNFIRDSGKDITTKDLIDFGQQIAEGMSYLGGMKYVHRDLAARNCMIDEYRIVKIGDFGLSRDIYEHDYYTSREGGPALPVKWMAIESLTHNVFNTKTDVWSFGVLLWELMTRGVPPYPDVDIYDMADYLLSDRRLRKPEECPTRVYKTMLSCWSKDPNRRPSFKHLARLLEQIKVSATVDKYVDILNNMPESKC
ncbi:PREDICTED: hepatocyte growth factor receptor-like [Branchiostoma belcheri]|uniref:Hepatocyte growth factor receptor-like n=1 Tax=Branchiostoma belcheri TaxID=7741 RepID=A0A6P4ZES9_BRABE|nr:PREDICTED: hepatocyte growth factor receptor-like [Branchiostoma belcheri]